MSADPKWPRWISASIAKHFEGLGTTAKFFVEADERNTSEYSACFELRVTGPEMFETSKDVWTLDIWIDLLCSRVLDANLYNLEDMIGKGIALFTQSIAVMKYGDDDSLLECLQQEDRIKVIRFGQRAPKWKIQQAAIGSRYRLHLGG